MHVKREPVEEHPECGERPMDMNALQSPYPNAIQTSHHQGVAPSIRTLDYNGYDHNFDQRLVNPISRFPLQQPYAPTQPNDELNRQEKLQKELNNYMLQHNIPSSTMLPHQMGNPIPTSEPERPEVSSTEMNILKMKRSNGKLAIPDILHSNGMKGIDLAQSLNTHQRAKREFVPDEKKDEGYWTKRVKNNDSARRSRVKRKALEKIMEGRLMELQQENIELRHELNALKRRYGIAEDGGRVASPSGYNFPLKSASVHSATSRSSSPPEKLSMTSKDDELEHQSSASDDSRSLDDSRSAYNIRSASALSQSFDLSHRERADSFSSCGSAANRSPNSNSPPYSHSYVRTDKTGALDLTSDLSARVNTTPTHTASSRDYNNSSVIAPASDTHSNTNTNTPESGHFNEEKMDTSMRGYPLKCRWKFSSTAPCSKTTGESNGSFPGV